MPDLTDYTSLEQIDARRAAIGNELTERLERMSAVIDHAQDEERDLFGSETVALGRERSHLSQLRTEDEDLHERRLALQVHERSRQLGAAIDQATGRVSTHRGHSPLLVSEAHLRSHADAIRKGA